MSRPRPAAIGFGWRPHLEPIRAASGHTFACRIKASFRATARAVTRRPIVSIVALWLRAKRIVPRTEELAEIPLPVHTNACIAKDENTPVVLRWRPQRQLSIPELYEYFKSIGQLWKFYRMFPPGLG